MVRCQRRSSAVGRRSPVAAPGPGDPGPQVGARVDLPRPVVVPHRQQRGGQHVLGPGGHRVTAGRARGRGAPLQRLPHALPRAGPSRVRAGEAGRRGERGHQRRAEAVQQVPAASHVGGVGAGVEAHLDGGGAVHHHRAVGTAAGEVAVERGVAGVPPQPPGYPVGVGAGAEQTQPAAGERGGEVCGVRGEPAVCGGEIGGRQGAELDLPAGFPAEGAATGERPDPGAAEHRLAALQGDGGARVGGVDDEPLELAADPPGRAGLEAHAADVVEHLVGVRQLVAELEPVVRVLGLDVVPVARGGPGPPLAPSRSLTCPPAIASAHAAPGRAKPPPRAGKPLATARRS